MFTWIAILYQRYHFLASNTVAKDVWQNTLSVQIVHSNPPLVQPKAYIWIIGRYSTQLLGSCCSIQKETKAHEKQGRYGSKI